MKFEIIETPPRRVFNAESRRLIACKANQCVSWLRANGFQIVAVSHGLYQPHITIKFDQILCASLDGVADAFERTLRGQRHFRFAVRFDCMVEWNSGAE